MRIDHYSFGEITIDGKVYTSDVVIYPDHVDPSWWRREGHRLSMEDIAGVVDAKPEIFIIGTGYSGMMVVPEETISFIRSKGIDLRMARTKEAVSLFNELSEGKRTVAALHLTC